MKILYARNLAAETTEDRLRQVFVDAARCDEDDLVNNNRQTTSTTSAEEEQLIVERVKKIKDYAFVHFVSRNHALTAMNKLNGKATCKTRSPP